MVIQNDLIKPAYAILESTLEIWALGKFTCENDFLLNSISRRIRWGARAEICGTHTLV